MRARLRVLLAAVALVAFSGSVWATCIEGAAASAMQQMACCRDGELTCAMHGSAHDCCTNGAAQPHHVVVAAKADPVHSACLAAAWTGFETATLVIQPKRTEFSISPPPLPSGPPPYIAFSSLLI